MSAVESETRSDETHTLVMAAVSDVAYQPGGLVRFALGARAASRAGARAGVVLMVVGLFAFAPAARTCLPEVTLFGLGFVICLGAFGARGLAWLATNLAAWAGWRARRAAWRAPLCDPGALRDTACARVVGRVHALRTLATCDEPVVMERIRFERFRTWADVHTGTDFLLDIETREPLRIETLHARIDDRVLRPSAAPRPVPRAVVDMLPHEGNFGFEDATIRDGDLVEVVGVLSHRVDPTVASRLDRDVPLRAVLSGTAERPLLVRRLARST